MSELLIMSGLPASGKSTYALEWIKENGGVRINYDDLRRDMYGPNWKFNRSEEDAMQVLARVHAEVALKSKLNVVIDNTSLSHRVRARWMDLAKSYDVPVIYHPMATSIEECIKRDLIRGSKRVGRAVIERMALWNNLVPPNDLVKIICDIDGTIADTSKRAHYVRDGKKDWKNFLAEVNEDTLIEPIQRLLCDFSALCYEIIMVSGRSIDPCGLPTEDWLNDNDVPYHRLYMRQGNDFRSDVIVKQEILDRLPKDQISFVLDDRSKVVKMWRDNGLTCLQVAEGDF